ncbi:carbonic anhydrase 4 [Esox lucius]|uniref:Carbonic anhydrase n=1 Tax=Esox lucius TaxID=8010 RepID=A0A3P8XLY4_ESOLU|nr:carbonic anhydrase 4 [Esox lucius]
MNRLVVIISICFVPTAYSSEADWCYNDPTCDDTTWPANFTHFCNGSRQSPINIVSAKAIGNVNLTSFNFTKYKDNSTINSLNNTGETVLVQLNSGVQISGGGLSEIYDSMQFHLHWGNGTSVPGSEHTVDGTRYPMEMHIVNTKAKYNRNITAASADSTGIAALGFFIEAMPGNTTGSPAAWKALTSYLDNITLKANSVNITSGFSLDDLLKGVNRTKYYRYLGSLTTPNCSEAVVWTVFKETIKVSKDLINLFSTRLHIEHNATSALMTNVYRKTQASNGRIVTTQATVSGVSKTSFSLGLMAWMLLMLYC